MDSFKDRIDDNHYFKSLPNYIQETIKQSGIDIDSEEELRECAENLLKD